MDIAIFGDGGLGRAVATAFETRGDRVRVLGRPATGRHDPAALDGVDLVVEASRAEVVRTNVDAALEAGCRRLIIATTGWTAERDGIDHGLRSAGAAAVAASNFSLGVALFGRLVDEAVRLFGPLAEFDPYLVEWHRRNKADRPSGTARDLADRIIAGHPGKRRSVDGAGLAGPASDELEVVAIRAGASPGMHLVGFDAPGETVELRLTARDRSAYASGVIAAADWLAGIRRAPGLHSFDPIVDELVARIATAA